METTKEIVRIVNGRVTRKLTQEELEKHEKEYLLEAERLAEVVLKGYEEKPLHTLMEKMVSPFEQWLQNKVQCEYENKKEKN